MTLNHEQISFFKRYGYLLVPGAMDHALCARVRDEMWAALPADSSVHRDDAATHLGPFAEHETAIDSVHTRQGYRWLNSYSADPCVCRSESLTESSRFCS